MGTSLPGAGGRAGDFTHRLDPKCGEQNEKNDLDLLGSYVLYINTLVLVD